MCARQTVRTPHSCPPKLTRSGGAVCARRAPHRAALNSPCNARDSKTHALCAHLPPPVHLFDMNCARHLCLLCEPADYIRTPGVQFLLSAAPARCYAHYCACAVRASAAVPSVPHVDATSYCMLSLRSQRFGQIALQILPRGPGLCSLRSTLPTSRNTTVYGPAACSGVTNATTRRHCSRSRCALRARREPTVIISGRARHLALCTRYLLSQASNMGEVYGYTILR